MKGRIKRLVELAKIDSRITELKEKEEEFKTKLAEAEEEQKGLSREVERAQKELKTQERYCTTEEKALKAEQEKLVERRKELSSFSSYKVQQAAMKEIEQLSKQLNVREEHLLQEMERLDLLKEETKSLEEVLRESEDRLSNLREGQSEKLEEVKKEFEELVALRESTAKELEEHIYSLYKRIQERHPRDPVVQVRGNTCRGCYMQIVPKLMVEIARGEDIVRCRSCGRILYIEQEEQGG